jgi:hypothetical protein
VHRAIEEFFLQPLPAGNHNFYNADGKSAQYFWSCSGQELPELLIHL